MLFSTTKGSNQLPIGRLTIHIIDLDRLYKHLTIGRILFFKFNVQFHIYMHFYHN